ncbi:hypothetical protein FIBSPDRAFT_200146 [Athelia psychrophila]|uniref:Uncharacterized protein n=1 Tax=Athelia psychrophila TaxID=1759441 RepID=A0A165ZP31_9AGAM|nr:hypothetical protein FIBSPDRAFT_200146 [Fibularhizoctonia sp. CBS 109695]
MLLPRCPSLEPARPLRSMELRNLQWAALSLDASARLTSTFQSLMACRIHHATFPHAQNLQQLIASTFKHLPPHIRSPTRCVCGVHTRSQQQHPTSAHNPQAMVSLPAELKSLSAAHLTAPAPCCPVLSLAALSLASVAWAAAPRPHLLAVIPSAFLPASTPYPNMASTESRSPSAPSQRTHPTSPLKTPPPRTHLRNLE